MDRNKLGKSLMRQIRRQFGTAALVCLAVIAVFSAFIVYLHSRVFGGEGELQNTDYAPKAAEFAAQINEIRIGSNSRLKLETLKKTYENFPEKLQQQVGRAGYEKLLEAIELEEALDANGGGLIIEDKSQNGFDLDLGKGEYASLKRYGSRAVLEGQADISGGSEADVLGKLFSGTHGFTIEAVVNPNDSGYYNALEPNDLANYNMIASKGDHCMGFRVSEQSLQFFIRSTNQKWMNVKIDLTDEQLHSWLHVAGMYDGENVMVYLEGSGIRTLPDAGAVVGSDYPFAIGHCPETGRTSNGSIESIRVYDRALTEEELDKGNIQPQDDAVVLWYDFSEWNCPLADTAAKGIRAYTSQVQLEEQQEEALGADPVPYYANGRLVFQTNRPQTVMVSETGTITGMESGSAKITVSLQETDFTAEIPVWVGDPPASLAGVVDWMAGRLILIDLAAFSLVLLLVALWQQKRMGDYLAEISEAVGALGESAETLSLPPALGEVQTLFDKAQERFLQKDVTVHEAERKKNELMAYLAHDLKTPIASTVGYLMLLRDEKQISAETRSHYAEIALNNAQRLDELIEEFFEITRFNMSHIELEYQEINLTWFLEQLVSEYKPMLAEKGLSCSLEVARNIRLQCDPDKMERVFDNLIRNAINYSYCNTEIRLTVQSGEKLTVTCENQGDTISEDKLARIFEQLYRVDNARSSDTGGSGLGLAIAKQIVEMHQGEIFAESKNNRIRFTVIIPWHAAGPEQK